MGANEEVVQYGRLFKNYSLNSFMCKGIVQKRSKHSVLLNTHADKNCKSSDVHVNYW